MGEILIACDDLGLTGLWFLKQRYFARTLTNDALRQEDHPYLLEAKRWLKVYFSGEKPDFLPALHCEGTPFQKRVWNILLEVPYGSCTTYGDIARQIARECGLSKFSAQAVGGAVGHNPVSIIIPCHRVVGADGSLTGYAGGIERKMKLLQMEGVIIA